VKFPLISDANAMARLKAYRNKSSVVPVPPAKIWIEPTNSCNLKCIHCVQPQMTRKKGLMDFSLFKKVVDEASSYGITLALTGQGEPLLHPEFTKMVKYASERVGTEVITNATLLNKEKSREILDAEPDLMGFSFDAPTKEIYESIRRGSDYDKTRQNILDFLDLKHTLGKEKTKTVIAIIIEPATKNEIEQFKRWCRTTGFDQILINRVINFRGETDLWQSGNVTDEYVKDYLPKSEWPVCNTPWEQVMINWDGTANGCILDYNNNFVIGNAAENTVMEIWNGGGMREFRDALVSKQYERVEQDGILCSKCNVLWWPESQVYQNISMASLYFAYYLLKILRKVGGVRLYHKLKGKGEVI